MNQTCTLGVDIGTTSVKVVAFSADGKEIDRAGQRLTLITDQPTWVEQDANAVYQAVEDSMLELLGRLKQGGWTVRFVGFSAAMHSLLGVSDDGRTLTNAMTWMDTRSAEEADELWHSKQGPAIYNATGTPIHPMAPLAKFMWMKRNNPSVLEKTAKFVSLKEWVWYQWFREWEVDASIANATGLYNIAENAWDADALALAGITPKQLSTIVPTTYVRDDLKAKRLVETGMLAGAEFNIGASDGCLANLGTGVIEAGDMVITIGTSCAVRAATRKPFTDVRTRSFCYVLDEGRYVVGGPSNSGGVVVDWLYRQVIGNAPTGGADGFDELLQQAEHVESDHLLFLPYVAGERAPIWNPDATCTIIGLQMSHTRAHVMRAAVEGVLLNAYWIASALAGEVGKPDRLLASGKLLEVPWIQQMTADIFGVPVVTATTADASVVGAAILAELATGQYGWEDVADKLQQFESEDHQTALHPDADTHARYQHKFRQLRRFASLLGLDASR